jgi:hypothetical protein
MSRSIVGSGDLCWSVGFSVEVLPSLVQSAGEASLLKINFSGFDIAVFSKLLNAQPDGWVNFPALGRRGAAGGSRLECVWYSLCQCVKQVGFEK